MADKVALEYKEGGTDFRPHSEGTVGMQVLDVISMGYRVKNYPGTEPSIQPFVALVWGSGEVNGNNELITVHRYYKTSMHKKAALRLALEAMRGKTYSEPEARKAATDPEFLSKLIGFPCLVTVEHKQSEDGDRTWGQVTNLAQLPKGMAKPKVTGYKRGEWWEDRKKKYAEEVARFGRTAPDPVYPEDYDQMPPALEEAEDDLPF